jgi:protein tyrosine/serine phosphatase
VRADYLASGSRFTFESIQSRMERYMGGPVPEEGLDAIRMLAGVDASYLAASLDGLLETHGSADAWLRDVAGLDDASRQRMRDRLLEG